MNFTQIFQDSWNFIRNRQQISLIFIVLFFALAFVSQWIIGSLSAAVIESMKNDPALSSQIPAGFSPEMVLSLEVMTHPQIMTVSFISQIISVLISVWGLMALHHISQQRFISLGQSFAESLRYFPGVLLLNILVLIPVVYGLLLLAMGSFIGIVLTVVGLYLFLRLCLAPMAYLIGKQRFSQSLKFVWQQSRGRLSVLLIYCLINYLLVSLLSNQLAAFSGNALLQIITTALSCFINFFALVFSYRFYHLFIRAA